MHRRWAGNVRCNKHKLEYNKYHVTYEVLSIPLVTCHPSIQHCARLHSVQQIILSMFHCYWFVRYWNSFTNTGSLLCLFNYCASLPAITPWPGGWLAEWATLIWRKLTGRGNWQLSDKMITLQYGIHLLYILYNTVIIRFARYFCRISIIQLIFFHLLNLHQSGVY